MGLKRETGKGGIKAEVKQFYERLGAVVYNTSGGGSFKRLGNTKGLPDLLILWPKRGVIIAHEVKTPEGKLSPEQIKFREAWEASEGLYVVGGLVAASDFVARLTNRLADPWPTPREPT